MAFRNLRWYGSWVLFISIVPLVAMYGVWASLTISGRLRPPPRELNLHDWFPLQTDTDVLMEEESQGFSNFLDVEKQDASPLIPPTKLRESSNNEKGNGSKNTDKGSSTTE